MRPDTAPTTFAPAPPPPECPASPQAHFGLGPGGDEAAAALAQVPAAVLALCASLREAFASAAGGAGAGFRVMAPRLPSFQGLGWWCVGLRPETRQGLRSKAHGGRSSGCTTPRACSRACCSARALRRSPRQKLEPFGDTRSPRP
jgi:hypothetical protein